MQIYIFRHGETILNSTGIVQGRSKDSALSAKGKAQIQCFYQAYAHLNFDALISSSQERSRASILPFNANGNRRLSLHELDEFSWGIHEGGPYTPELIEAYRKLITAWHEGKWTEALEGGESAEELTQRVDKFIDMIGQEPWNRILVCTHGRTLKCLICRLLGWDLRKMEDIIAYNTGLFVIEKKVGYLLKTQNDVSHLTEDLLPGNHDFKG